MTEVVRFQKPYPRVALRSNLSFQGNLIVQGPEQSEVHWDNGWKDTSAINTWIVRLGAGGLLPDGKITNDYCFQPATIADEQEAKARVRAKQADDLSDRLKAYDPAALKQFALNNGVWDAKYETLPNPGLARMSVINRLRARVKRGYVTVWK